MTDPTDIDDPDGLLSTPVEGPPVTEFTRLQGRKLRNRLPRLLPRQSSDAMLQRHLDQAIPIMTEHANELRRIAGGRLGATALMQIRNAAWVGVWSSWLQDMAIQSAETKDIPTALKCIDMAKGLMDAQRLHFESAMRMTKESIANAPIDSDPLGIDGPKPKKPGF